MNIRFLRHLDVRALCSTAYRLRNDIVDSVTLQGAGTNLLADERWKAAASTVRRIRQAILDDIDATRAPVSLGKMLSVALDRIAPNIADAWDQEGDEKLLRFILALETNPGCQLFVAGAPPLHVEIGCLWWYRCQTLHSMLNAGASPALHLIVDFERES